MYQLTFRVIKNDVDDALTKLSVLMSDNGLAAFLGVAIGPYLRQRAQRRFSNEGDDVSGTWAPLHPATIIRRADDGYPPGPINRRSGELENWVVGSGWDAYPIVKGASLRFPGKRPSGILKDKVQTAQAGSTAPVTVPRPVIGLNETDLLFFQTALALAVQDAMQ